MSTPCQFLTRSIYAATPRQSSMRKPMKQYVFQRVYDMAALVEVLR